MIRAIVLLATLLACTVSSVSVHAAQIKSKDGTLIEGEIRGTLVLRDLTHTEVDGGGWGLLYYVIPGKKITLINEQGVHWHDGKDIVLYLYIMKLDPGDDLRGLSPEFVTRFKFLREYKGGNSSDTTGPPGVNPIPMAVYGEVRFENGNPKILPEFEVVTAKGVTKVPVSSIVAVVPKSKADLGNLPPATPESIASGKQILSSVKQTMGGSAIDKITDQKTTANASQRTNVGFIDIRRETTFKLPNKVLCVEIFRTGRGDENGVYKFGFDGSTKWDATRLHGTKVLSDSEMEDRLSTLGSNVLMLLQNYNSEAYTVQALAKSELEGKAVDVVAATNKSSQETTILLVDDTRLPLKVVSISSPALKRAVSEELLSDYREVDGIKVAYKATIMWDGLKQQDISLSEVKFNTGVSDSVFLKP